MDAQERIEIPVVISGDMGSLLHEVIVAWAKNLDRVRNAKLREVVLIFERPLKP